MRQSISTVYFLDNSAQNKKLMRIMRAKATEKQYEYACPSNGKLFVRKCSDEPAIQIACDADLEKMM